MITKRLGFASTLIALFVLGACASEYKEIDDGQYWQRASVSDAIYMRGPKAQQMLNRDIARCVFELRELERLGAVKNAIPTDAAGRVMDPDQKELYDWDTPERDHNLLMEHGDYHNFETCMLFKGWERISHVPYEVAQESRANYYKVHMNYNKEPDRPQKKKMTSNNSGDFGSLND